MAHFVCTFSSKKLVLLATGLHRKLRLTRPAPGFPIPQGALPSLPRAPFQNSLLLLCSMDRSPRVYGHEPSWSNAAPSFSLETGLIVSPDQPSRQTGTPTPGAAPEHANRHSPGVTGSNPKTSRVSRHTLHMPHRALCTSTPLRFNLKISLRFLVRSDGPLQKPEQYL